MIGMERGANVLPLIEERWVKKVSEDCNNGHRVNAFLRSRRRYYMKRYP